MFKFLAFHRKKGTYIYFFFQVLYVVYKLVVKMYLNIVGARKVIIRRFWPHCNERISECRVISER